MIHACRCSVCMSKQICRYELTFGKGLIVDVGGHWVVIRVVFV